MIGIGDQSSKQQSVTTFEHLALDTTNLKVLSNFADKTLEWQLPNEELCGLLVTTNLTKSDGTRPEAVRLLHTTGSGSLLRGAQL